jgi:hypothetical protein
MKNMHAKGSCGGVYSLAIAVVTAQFILLGFLAFFAKSFAPFAAKDFDRKAREVNAKNAKKGSAFAN